MKTVRRPPYPKWNPGYFPCSSLTPLPLSSRRPSVSFGGFGLSRDVAYPFSFSIGVESTHIKGSITMSSKPCDLHGGVFQLTHRRGARPFKGTSGQK